MAEDAVRCEPFSGGFPENREKYREFAEIPIGEGALEGANPSFHSGKPVSVKFTNRELSGKPELLARMPAGCF